MKNLNQYLPTFSADYAGASNVVYEMDTLLIVHDGTSCAGHAYGMDEPRYMIDPLSARPAFSTHIKEVEAVTGNDEKNIQKIIQATEWFDMKFITVIGSPVTALIGTDFNGFASIIEKRTNIPCIGIDTSGFETYDVGISKAYMKLAKKFIGSTYFEPETCEVNVLGTVVTDMWDIDSVAYIKQNIIECGAKSVACWGADATVEQIAGADKSKLNIVVSASGMEVARYLHKKYQTPYIVGFPVGEKSLHIFKNKIKAFFENPDTAIIDTVKKHSIYEEVLVIGEQVSSNGIRECLMEEYDVKSVDCVTFFAWEAGMAESHDRKLKCEEDLETYLKECGPYDLVIGDPMFKKVISTEAKEYLEFPHLAVSSIIKLWESFQYIGEFGSRYFDHVLTEQYEE